MSCSCDPVPDAILFDLDGTLADSTASVERCWAQLADELGMTGSVLFRHGVPADTLIREFLPDATDAERQAVFDRQLANEIADAHTVTALPGARELIELLDERGMPWGIATSGMRPLALARIEACGLPRPKAFLAGGEALRGKPHPDPFLVLAEHLGADAAGCIVVEDAPAGVTAGRASGAIVCAITHTHSAEELADAHYVVDSLDELRELFLERGFVKGTLDW